MKIVFLGNFQVAYTSETHHKKSLEALGHEVLSLQETQAGGELVLGEAKKADMFVWVHTHGWQTPGLPMREVLNQLRAAGIPSVTYHLDLWLGLERQKDVTKDDVYNHIDHFFTVDPKMAEWFNANTKVRGHYLQAGVFHEECYISSSPTVFQDVVFVGSKGYHPEWPYRPLLIDWLRTSYRERFTHVGGDGIGVYRGDPLNALYAGAKVVVGDSLSIGFDYPGYWSDRVYETIGRGGFIIHPFIEGMQEHFEDKKHLGFYKFGDFPQLKSLIDYYLEHSEERESIRLAGHEHVKANHTYKQRWEHILKEVESHA